MTSCRAGAVCQAKAPPCSVSWKETLTAGQLAAQQITALARLRDRACPPRNANSHLHRSTIEHIGSPDTSNPVAYHMGYRSDTWFSRGNTNAPRPLSGCRSSDIGLSRRHGLSRRRRICRTRMAFRASTESHPCRPRQFVDRVSKMFAFPGWIEVFDAHPWNDHAKRHRHDDQQGGAGVGERGRQQLRWRAARRATIPQQCRPPCGTGRRPESIETTEAKANAANGNRRRAATGVAIVPTNRQATNAPTWTLVPATAIATQRNAWASMPMAMGIGSIRQGMAKNEPNAETAMPAATTS